MEKQSILSRFKPSIAVGLITIFGLYLFLIQFTTSTPYIRLLPLPTSAVATLAMSFVFLLYWFIFIRKTNQLNETESLVRNFVIAYSASILLAIFSALYTTTVLESAEYAAYIGGSMLQRILYYIVYIGMLYFGYKVLTNFKATTVRRLIAIYPLSFFVLVLVGIWQLLYFFYNIPFLDIETRSYVHSVSGSSFFNFRLTSFADEPSYLGPVLIDMIILGYLVFKKKWLYAVLVFIPALLILVFSFSVSAYLNLVLLVGFIIVYLVFHPKFPKKYLWYLLGLGVLAILAIVLVKPNLMAAFFSPILGRFDSLFNPQSSSRIYMYIMPIYWLFDHSLVSALFGYGPGSYDFLHLSKILPNKVSIATSSNNMYIDLLFEHGIIGFLLIAGALLSLGIKLWKHGRKNGFYFIALLSYVHILITALYRADFVTPRFWGLLLIIFLLMWLGEKREKENEIKEGSENETI